MKPRMRVSTFTLALLATTTWTGLAAAETLTVTDIEIKGENGFELRVPSIEAVDANVDEAAIRMLFTEDFTKSAKRWLASTRPRSAFLKSSSHTTCPTNPAP